MTHIRKGDDTLFLDTLTTEWTDLGPDCLFQQLRIRDFTATGNIEVDGRRARLTNKGAKLAASNTIRKYNAVVWDRFVEGVTRAINGEYVGTWEEIFEGEWRLPDERKRCALTTVKAAMAFARATGRTSADDLTIEDYMQAISLVGVNVRALREARAA